MLGKILKQEGRSQKWLAEKLGKSPQTVNSWIVGRSRCPDECKVKISELLGIPIEEIFFVRDKKKGGYGRPIKSNTDNFDRGEL